MVKDTLNILQYLHYDFFRKYVWPYFQCYVLNGCIIVALHALYCGCSTEKMLWKLHKAHKKYPW